MPVNAQQQPPFDNRAIGIFDSGVGGLSIAKKIAEQLPDEDLIYIADTLHAPYGEKSVAFIQQRVNSLARILVAKNVKAIVVACNTATVNAIEQLRTQLDIPIIGVEPAIKPAALKSKNKKVGILVTQATAENKRFLALVEQHKNGSEVFIQPCPGLVELIEQRQLASEKCQQLLRQYLAPLMDKNIDSLVLGCTHYPFLSDKIQAIVGPNIQLLETAAPVTSQLKRMLTLHSHLQESRLPENSLSETSLSEKNQLTHYQFYSSLASQHQQQLFSELWQTEIQLKQLS